MTTLDELPETASIWVLEERDAAEQVGPWGASRAVRITEYGPRDWTKPFQRQTDDWHKQRIVEYVPESALASERLAHEQTKRELWEVQQELAAYTLLLRADRGDEAAQKLVAAIRALPDPTIAARPDDGGEGGK